MKVTDKMKTILMIVTEGTLAIGMVFICFLLITDLLEILFPTNLPSELTTTATTETSVLQHPHWRRLRLAKGNLQSDLDVNQKLAATVMTTRNSVQCKRSTAVSWQKGQPGMLLYPHDALQTLPDASALVEFDAHNRTRLDEKTLIIIKQMEHDPIFNDNRTFVLLVEGALQTQLSRSEITAAYLNLETPHATLRMHSMDGMINARVVAGPDNTSTLSVYQGAVEVVTKTQRRLVRANRAVRISLEKPLDVFVGLPPPVTQLAPEDRVHLVAKERSGNVRFSWRQATDATGYHFMLARDSHFNDLLIDRTLQKDHFTWRNPVPGVYYWRVSMQTDDIEGYYSKTRRLHIDRRIAPPRLLDNYPPEKVYYRSVVPTVGFAWQKRATSRTYYWQLARDDDFTDIVKQKTCQSNRINSDNLTEGVYYWRVGLRGAANQPIRFSAARRLEIIRDATPPPLFVGFPATASYDQAYMITGRTEPDAIVFINGYEATVTPSGDFQYAMRLNKGKNVIAVAATDAANNVTSKSRIVICK